MKKKLISLFLIFHFLSFTFSGTFSNQQLIESGHWIYDALIVLFNENQSSSFVVNSPLTVGELKFYFSSIIYENLSENGKNIYEKVKSFFEEKSSAFRFNGGFASINLKLNPTLFYKTNDNLDWSFGTDYTGKILGSSKNDKFNIENFEKITENGELKFSDKTYGSSSNYYNINSKGFVEADLNLGWGDYFMINTVPTLTKNFWALTENSNFINLPTSADSIEFFQPVKAWASFGKNFEDWGINLNVNRQGLQIGKTLTGSVIYNSTFLTDFYTQINIYNKFVRYNLDVVEVSKNRYMYLHQLEVIPYFPWLKLGMVEGTFVNGPFELRFLNPLMFMHSHGSWVRNLSDGEKKWLGEANICQYMGIMVEANPFKNSRIYFLYAQNEIQSAAEKDSVYGKSFPDSFGLQLGFEYTKSDKFGGFYTFGLEGIYTTPFLYLKQGKDWSLYSYRYDMQNNGSYPICSWIGSPFGPDAVGGQFKAKYTNLSKWEAEFDYLFLAHGTNSFGIFNNSVIIDGIEYSAYYPTVLKNLGLLSDEEVVDLAQNLNLTGIIQYTNQISLKGKYILNEHFSFSGNLIYSFVFNNKNVSGNFQHGLEISLGAECKLFK